MLGQIADVFAQQFFAACQRFWRGVIDRHKAAGAGKNNGPGATYQAGADDGDTFIHHVFSSSSQVFDIATNRQTLAADGGPCWRANKNDLVGDVLRGHHAA